MQYQALYVGSNAGSAGFSALPRFTGPIHCISHTLQTEGIRGLYRGIVPTTWKSVLATAVTFAAFEKAKTFLEENRNIFNSNSRNGLPGVFSKLVSPANAKSSSCAGKNVKS